MKQEDVIELVVHPSFRAAVDRQLHATLVRLGLAQPAPPVLTDEDGNPLPESQQVPAIQAGERAGLLRHMGQQGRSPAPHTPKEKKPSALQRQALENGWVSSGVVQAMVGRTGTALMGYVKRGLLERAAHGYYTKQSYDRLKAWLDKYGQGSPGHVQHLRAMQKDRWERNAPRVPDGHLTLADAAKLYGKSYYTLRHLVVDQGVEHLRVRVAAGGEQVMVNAQALADFMATYKGRKPKKAAMPSTTNSQLVPLEQLATAYKLKRRHAYEFVTYRNVSRTTVPGPRRGTVLVDAADFAAKWAEKPLAIRGPRKKNKPAKAA